MANATLLAHVASTIRCCIAFGQLAVKIMARLVYIRLMETYAHASRNQTRCLGINRRTVIYSSSLAAVFECCFDDE